ncbi:zinc carboxypeptidase [Microdochium trichocladiopsis]|uniref:Zinc carboxypeptidase n=1 Tax=Microdochium trichocladiopsis TaxID=1682393 RepID=A0A9P9BKP3_9PEZI|nr:zinc carboxypeptidase [Microdochium trichocladiopsis]KAH7021416.1 zinc carboxypeptidase [Microdochium trichocladiopsis]
MKASVLLSLAALSSTGLACLLPEERDGTMMHRVVRRQGQSGTPIGTGDRFSGGSVVPRGLGSQTGVTFSTILNPTEIVSGLKALSNTYGITTFTTPYKTYNGATIYGAQVGGTGSGTGAYKVFFNGNIHARERGSADNVLYFIADLLYANKNNVGLTYGSKTYTAAQVKTALAAGIVFIPLSNPDGVAYDQSTGSCWRKNRRPNSGGSYGVDLNRNFDFVWDFTKKFASSVAGSTASTSPSSETYHGTAAFSEPETKSIKWVFDTYAKVRWFIDLHSYTGDVLYSWGSDDNQSKYPYMNFLNSTYDSVRGILTDTPGSGKGYGEYVPAAEGTANAAAAQRLASGLTAGGGKTYGYYQASDLYPTSGASDDYAYSRHFADPSKNLVHAYTVEFGFGSSGSCPFYPSVANYNENIRATNAGFFEFLLAATELGLE